MDEAVLAYASGWCPALPTVATDMPNNTGHVTTSKTYGGGTGGVGDPRANKIAVTIGTFGLTVKLGSATFEFLFSTVPKSTKSIGGAPEGRQCAPLLGRRVSPSLAEFTVVEPD